MTEFSTLDGINRVDTLPEHVRDNLGQKALACTEHGTLSGAYKFTKSCRKAGIKPIIGLEAYYSITDIGAKELDIDGNRYYHLVMLAKNRVGLKNLVKLSSRAYAENMYYRPRTHDSMIAEHGEGIIATTACLGSRFSKLILMNRKAEAERLIDHHSQMFEDFFIELQLHEDEDQQTINRELVEISRRKNIPLVLTNDSHYTFQQDKQVHEMALCMQTNDVLSNPKRFSFGDIDVHLAHHDWMAENAQRQGIPYAAIANTVHIANMIKDNEYFDDIYNQYPKFKHCLEGYTPDEELAWQAKTKLTERMGGTVPQEYRERLITELKTIKQVGFSDYMLIVSHMINHGRDELKGWFGPGRGSAAGSLVAYALGITQIDPIKYGLLFSRFLSMGRSAKPMVFDDATARELKASLSPDAPALQAAPVVPHNCSHSH